MRAVLPLYPRLCQVGVALCRCRKPGQRSIIRNMVAEIDKGQFEFEDYGDIHTIGSLLKKFFQELTDSLIPGEGVCVCVQF